MTISNWVLPVDSENVLPRWDQITSSAPAAYCSSSQQTPSEQRLRWARPRWPSSQGNQSGLSQLRLLLATSIRRNANHTCQGVLPAGSQEISPYPPRARKDEDWPWERSAKGSQVPHYYYALSSGCPLKSPVFMCVSHSVVCDSLQPHVALQAPPSMELSRQEYWSG